VTFTNIVFVAFGARRVFPAFNALIAAHAFPVSALGIFETLANMPIGDCGSTVDAVYVAVFVFPPNPILNAPVATVLDRVFGFAARAILFDNFVAVGINNFGKVKTVFTNAFRDILARKESAGATVGAHRVWILRQLGICDGTNFAKQLRTVVAAKAWVAHAVGKLVLGPLHTCAGDAKATVVAVGLPRAVKVLTEATFPSRRAIALHIVQSNSRIRRVCHPALARHERGSSLERGFAR
jgi:hypothetical protein